MVMLLDFLKFLLCLDVLSCSCCGTKNKVDYFGYSDKELCYPCAEEHGYWSSKWKHECHAKR